MSKIIVYDATAEDQAVLAAALAEHDVTFVQEPLSENTLVADAEVISVFVTSIVNAPLIEKCTNLKLVATRSTGYDHIDLMAVHDRQIGVVAVPTYGEHTVAEYTLGLLLMLTRKLLPAIEATKRGDGTHDSLRGTDLFGKTCGVIGAGRIGRNVARATKGLGMDVIAYDPMPNDQEATAIGFAYVPLEELLQKADVITLHVPYTPQTHHLLNATRLALLKPTAYLINTARGELIDTKALIDRLQKTGLAGVALDVVESEKLLDINEELALLRADQVPPAALEQSLEINILKQMPQVIMTGHNAFNTAEAIERINRTTAENIKAYLSGQPVNEVKAA